MWTSLLTLLCCLLAWGLLLLLALQSWQALTGGLRQVRRLHQIPCPECRFFTGNYTLKCTVYPYRAGSEGAIGCSAFEADRLPQDAPNPLH
jgi:hypothetical protein